MNVCIKEKDYKFKYQEVPEKSHEPQDILPLTTDTLPPSHHMRSLTLRSSQFYCESVRHCSPHTCRAAEARHRPDPLAKLWIMTWGSVFLAT